MIQNVQVKIVIQFLLFDIPDDLGPSHLALLPHHGPGGH